MDKKITNFEVVKDFGKSDCYKITINDTIIFITNGCDYTKCCFGLKRVANYICEIAVVTNGIHCDTRFITAINNDKHCNVIRYIESLCNLLLDLYKSQTTKSQSFVSKDAYFAVENIILEIVEKIVYTFKNRNGQISTYQCIEVDKECE